MRKQFAYWDAKIESYLKKQPKQTIFWVVIVGTLIYLLLILLTFLGYLYL